MPSTKKQVGHRGRLRQKFLDFGLDKFTDEEIVELLLTLATPRRDCKIAARTLLKECGSLAAVLERSLADLQQVEGVGPTNAFGIRFIQEVARKYLRERMLTKNYIKSFDDARDYFTHALREEKSESLHVLYLNAQNAILGEERLGCGGAASVEVAPRKVMERAFAMGAVTLVLAHNHPGGLAQPSNDDCVVTKELLFAAGLLDLTISDHLIIAGTDYYSFRQEGLMAQYDKEFRAFHKRLLSAP